ncbi:MAG TPA: hypothetical protein VK165_00175 [Azonexus sp.]|nr:hypothetical protein [Azonexus sp.]
MVMAYRRSPARPGFLQFPPRNIDLLQLLTGGVFAGTLATLAQLALWWLTDMPVLPTLIRDAHLTAAMVMGSGILSPPMMLRWDVFLIATLIHFALSVVYAAAPALIACRLSMFQAMAMGIAYGLAIYAINLHGFTAFFPWFAVSRDWPTTVAHAVFGSALFGWFLAGCPDHSPPL